MHTLATKVRKILNGYIRAFIDLASNESSKNLRYRAEELLPDHQDS